MSCKFAAHNTIKYVYINYYFPYWGVPCLELTLSYEVLSRTGGGGATTPHDYQNELTRNHFH